MTHFYTQIFSLLSRDCIIQVPFPPKQDKKMNVVEYKTPTLTLKVHENHIVAMANNFVRVTEKELNFLAVVANKHFTGPFGLVEVRDKDVSMDPQLHARVKEVLPNFSAYALVTNSTDTLKNMKREEAFMAYENFRLCSTISEASNWVKFVLDRNYPDQKIA